MKNKFPSQCQIIWRYGYAEDYSILLVAILFGTFADSIETVDLKINGKQFAKNNKIKLNPEDQLNVVIKFIDNAEYDCKIFAPSLQYHYENSSLKYEYNLTYAIYGLPIKDNSIEKYYNLFQLQE